MEDENTCSTCVHGIEFGEGNITYPITVLCEISDQYVRAWETCEDFED